jgi:tetratricopeptide (TPR) repeat protein/transglutaminase-like putative cysteine protease
MMLVRPSCVVALLLTCAVSAHTQDPPPQPSFVNEAFVVEQAKTMWRFEDDGTGRREQYMRVKVQSEAGVQQWGQVVEGYNAANETLEIAYVRVRKADGTVIATPPDSVQDLTSPVERIAPVYTDFRQKHVTVQSLRPGDTLEASFVTTLHTALAPHQFWGEYDFHEDGIVLDEQFDLDLPASRKMLLKVEPGFDAQPKESGGRRMYHWARSHTTREELTDEQKKKKAIKAVTDPERSSIRFTTFTDWAEVGNWFASLEGKARQVTPEIRAKAADLTKGRTSDLARLEALYDYVSKNFRYVSLSLGAGRYQPRAAADVLRDAYGDCKDKHTLLATLIDAAGLHASAVLINSGVKIDPAFPSPSQFDHVITRASVGGEDVWLDSTPEVGPFRMLASSLRHKQALLADATGSRLIDTPPNPPMQALVATDVHGTVSDAGTLSADVKFTLRGDLELLLRMAFRATPAPQWKVIVQRMSEQGGMNGDVSAVDVSDPQATNGPFTVAFHVQSTGFVQLAGRSGALPMPMEGSTSPGDPTDGLPIDLGAPGVASYSLSLSLPAAVKIQAPVNVSLTRDYADFKSVYAVNGAVFTATRTLTNRERELPEARGDDYKAFTRVLRNDSEQHATVDATAVVSSATAAPDAAIKELNNRAYTAMQAGDYATAITLLKKAVETDPKNQWAWTNLGTSYIADKQFDEALVALKKEAELNAYDEHAYSSMGRAYVMQKKYAEAEAAFNKQLEINPLDRYTPGALGAMYAEQRNYEKAAAAYEKWVAVNPDQAGPHVQLGKAYMNLHRVEDARKEFNRAVEMSPTPGTWNDVAYELSLGKVDLDTAQRYAESAVAAETAASRNLDLDHVDARALGVVNALASYWDTLGWVFFAKGDLAQAERYVAASWRLSQHPEVGDHLAQIYEKHGRTADAIAQYAAALAGENPAQLVREHLAALAGPDVKPDALVSQHKRDLDAARTFTTTVKAAAGTKADVAVLLSAPNVVDGIRFIGGDRDLATTVAGLKTLPLDGAFPTDSPAKLLRRGTITCGAGDMCTLTLVLPGDAKPVK